MFARNAGHCCRGTMTRAGERRGRAVADGCHAGTLPVFAEVRNVQGGLMRQLRASKVIPLSIYMVTAVLGAACQEWLDPADRYSGSLTSGTPRGALRLLLTDAPLDEVERVDVTIDRVDVTFADGAQAPQTILDEPKTFNLLDLRGGFTAVLAEAALPIGRIQQIRLVVAAEGNSVTVDGEVFDLRIPSGEQTGIKLTRPGGFVISEDTTTEVVIDFDAEHSLHHNQGQGWLLRPVVTLVDGVVLSVTTPRPGAFVTSRQVAVEGTVAAPAGVTSVTANGVACSVDAGAFTCAITLDEGAQQIEVVATDAGGVEARVTITVTVDTYPPHVEIVSPYEGRVVIGTLGLQAAARDASGIAGVTLYLDGQAVATVSLEPYLRWLESGDYVNGEHVFHAVAVDRAGHSAASQQVRATFDNIQGFGIASVEPLQGAVGTFVTIRGAGFEPPVRVFFGEVEAEVVEATGSVVLVRVPQVVQRVAVRVALDSGQVAVHGSAFLPLAAASVPHGNIDTFDASSQPPVLIVKLAEGSQLRARGGNWASDGLDDLTGMVSAISDLCVLAVERRTPMSEAQARSAHASAEAYWGSDEADPLLTHQLVFDEGCDATALYQVLSALPLVEYASFVPILRPQQSDPLPPPTPLLSQSQFYRLSSTATEVERPDGRFDPCAGHGPAIGRLEIAGGLGFEYINNLQGGRGEGVRVVDIEAAWEPEHEDLPTISRSLHPEVWIGTPAPPPLPFPQSDVLVQHGTAVAGILWAEDNGYGTTGVVPLSMPLLATVFPEENRLEQNAIDAAIDRAVLATLPGDVILIEDGVLAFVRECQTCLGLPCWCEVRAGAQLPAEAIGFFAEAIRQAVGQGRVVVEVAANGMQLRGGDGLDLDQVWWNPAVLRKIDVDRAHDTGAIMVGGSEPDDGWYNESNFGTRVDVHAYSHQIATTGYCDYFWAFANESDDPLPACNVWSLDPEVDRPLNTCDNVPWFRTLDPRQGYTAWFGGTSAASAQVAGAAAALQGYYKVLRQRGDAWFRPDNLRSLMSRTGRWVNRRPEDKVGPLVDVERAARDLQVLAIPPYFRPRQNAFPFNLTGVIDIVVADFDIDGTNEIFLARDGFDDTRSLADLVLGRDDCGAAFCEQNQNFAFQDATSGGSGAAVAADFDLDGDIDLYTTAGHVNDTQAVELVYQNNTDWLLRRQLNAVTPWQHPSRMPLFAIPSFDAAAGDVNADSRPDIIVASTSNRTHLVMNQSSPGQISFYDGAAHLPALPESDNLVAVVFDIVSNGSSADIFIGRGPKQYPVPPEANPDVLLRNRGPSCFSDRAAICFDVATDSLVAAPHETTSAVVVDFNGDGLLDIVAGTTFATMVPVLYQNQGNGVFVDVAATLLAADALAAFTDTTHDVVAGDFDYDGDADLLFATQAGLVLLERRDHGASGRYHLPDPERFGSELQTLVAHKLAFYPRSDGSQDLVCASADGLAYFWGIAP